MEGKNKIIAFMFLVCTLFSSCINLSLKPEIKDDKEVIGLWSSCITGLECYVLLLPDHTGFVCNRSEHELAYDSLLSSFSGNWELIKNDQDFDEVIISTKNKYGVPTDLSLWIQYDIMRISDGPTACLYIMDPEELIFEFEKQDEDSLIHFIEKEGLNAGRTGDGE